MRIYWSLKSIPELSDLPNEERRQIWVATRRGPFRHWQYWAAVLGAFLVLMLLVPLVDVVQSMGSRIVIYSLALYVFVLFIRQVGFYFIRPYMREYLQREQTEEQVDG